MIGKEVSAGKPVPVSLVRDILAKREKGGELHYEQKLALEYSRKFAKMESASAIKLVGELMGLGIPRFKERHATKITDVMPMDDEGVKAIFAKESISLKKDQIGTVLGVLAKYR